MTRSHETRDGSASGAEAIPAPSLSRAARADYRRLSTVEHMPPKRTHQIRCQFDIAVAADDGATLLTDHWYPATEEHDSGRVVLVRTPYGRRGMAGFARFIAERGHHVVIQSCRGTFGSSGRFSPLHDEAADGQATMRWLRHQAWGQGTVMGLGFSYFGWTQWAMADGPLRPDAMIIGLSARAFDSSIIYPGGGFATETAMTWFYSLAMQEKPAVLRLFDLIKARYAVAKGGNATPDVGVRVATGADSAEYQQWLEHNAPGDQWWKPYHCAQSHDLPPIFLLAGWQDLFLTGGFDDYRDLRQRGCSVKLFVGDWTRHGTDAGGVAVVNLLTALDKEAVDFSDRPELDLAIVNKRERLSSESWPPAGTSMAHAKLTGDGTLLFGSTAPLNSDSADTADGPDTPNTADVEATQLSWLYDPKDPTPRIGGRTLNPFISGRKNQQRRERRSDVLSFTSEPLRSELTLVGEPKLTLDVEATAHSSDLFVVLCDVDDKGRSWPIADGYRRGVNRSSTSTVTLTPTGYRVAAGHRLRLQVSSGAHPLYLRNPGTADPLHDFSQLHPSRQMLKVGPQSATSLQLPLFPASLSHKVRQSGASTPIEHRAQGSHG